MHAVYVRHIFALIFSFLLSIYLVPIIILAAKKIGFMDAPDGRLKQQREPIPYLGGLAVFIPFITTLGLCYPFENQMLWLLLGTTLLLFVGLVDDLKVLKPSQKFFGQFIAALCFLKGEFSLKTLFFSSVSNIIWSVFWMLSIINAFNLVDVMDGLCATLALTSACGFAVMAFVTGQYTTSLLLTAFIGAVAGFLLFNKPQAKIYLGDAGSLFIGGFLAAIPLLFNVDKSLFVIEQNCWLYTVIRPLLEVFFIPCLILAVPLLEVISLFIIRTRIGIPFYNGSPHHFSIYLQKKGWGKNKVLAFSAGVSLAFALLAFLFINHVLSLVSLCIGVVSLISGWVYAIFFHQA
jgi:UDP-GlcNAc:undecaprenyl-phosphate/decaprenyl-phosphate GlcNAc-1-phosphate transferase